ncbi:MAG: phosphotyrosine protein phosphatase [SAR86 cluster bacterium]|uniref:protein-tyrosine-phosphatase n=1 Tax=SAR86 cluster bacterium TaxID=2030880 RepID=A0A2A4X0W4_9GAMM|nr:MAG: phosphotyrosine protein phosphatase [SAR86 cluster bacterium]
MVCLGNICRSPTAHGVLEKLIQNKGLSKFIEVDSAGTSTYHIGAHPDSRSIAAARRRGYSLEKQVARQVRASDFQEFDYVLAMDVENLQHLERAAPPGSKAKVQLLLDYSAEATESVPDPYFGAGGQGFETVLDLVEDTCRRLFEQLEDELSISEKEQ